MEIAKIEVNDFGGAPACEHNMPCAVCGMKHAIYELSFGYFQPCWDCQEKGWKLKRKLTLKEWLRGIF